MNEHYDTLGVDKEASTEEIKKRYRKLAREHHPDTNDGSPESEAKFKKISEAYSVLSDPNKRRNYDLGFDTSGGRSSGTTHFNMGGFSFNMGGHPSPFGAFANSWGGGFADMFQQAQKRNNERFMLNININVSLEEAFNGCTKDIKYNRRVLCKECDGSKMKSDSKIITCEMCKGRGSINGGNSIFQITEPCPKCSGAGRRIENPCQKCSGVGFCDEKVEDKIKIPKGMLNNMGIKKNKGGHQNEDKTWQECIMRVHVEKHNIFEIEGSTVHLMMPIPIHLAIIGGEMEIPTLHGIEKVNISEKIGQNDNLILKNKGFPVLNKEQYGDQHVHFLFEFPKKVSPDIIEKLKTMNLNECTYPEYASVLKKFR